MEEAFANGILTRSIAKNVKPKVQTLENKNFLSILIKFQSKIATCSLRANATSERNFESREAWAALCERFIVWTAL